jgi:hypothetical protein
MGDPILCSRQLSASTATFESSPNLNHSASGIRVAVLFTHTKLSSRDESSGEPGDDVSFKGDESFLLGDDIIRSTRRLGAPTCVCSQ